MYVCWILCLVLCIVTVITASVLQGCPQNAVQLGLSCYWLSEGEGTYNQARALCEGESTPEARLAVLPSAYVYDFFIQNVLTAESGQNMSHWLGLVDIKSGGSGGDALEREWQWINGVPSPWIPWQAGKPSGYSADFPNAPVRDCANIGYINHRVKDIRCTAISFYSACELRDPNGDVFELAHSGERQDVLALEEVSSSGLLECTARCQHNHYCHVVNFNTDPSSSHTCQLLSVYDATMSVFDPGWQVWAKT